MGWASGYINRLQHGETVRFRPRGESMRPYIEPNQLCTVAPVPFAEIQVGDIVLCRVHGMEYLHLVKARERDRVQIANARGRVNGWVGPAAIFGKLVKVEG